MRYQIPDVREATDQNEVCGSMPTRLEIMSANKYISNEKPIYDLGIDTTVFLLNSHTENITPVTIVTPTRVTALDELPLYRNPFHITNGNETKNINDADIIHFR